MLIFGIFGGLRCKEYVDLKISSVEDTGNKLIISVADNKNDYPREFLIGRSFYNVVKKYISLRPSDFDCDRFFINYKQGKCSRQPMGKNSVGTTPSTIANYLNLENPERYTGHSFRRTCATLLSNSGASVAFLKSHLGWRSDAVAIGYVEHSLAQRQEAFDKIANTGKDSPFNNSYQPQVIPTPSTSHNQQRMVVDPRVPRSIVQQSNSTNNRNDSNNSQSLMIHHNNTKINNSKQSSYSNNNIPLNMESTSTDKHEINIQDSLDLENDVNNNLAKQSNVRDDYRRSSHNNIDELGNNNTNPKSNQKKRKISEHNSDEQPLAPQMFYNCTVTIHQLTVNNNYCQNH